MDLTLRMKDKGEAKLFMQPTKVIAKLLGYLEKEVEEDVFYQAYLKEKGHCFEIFTRDLLGKRIS